MAEHIEFSAPAGIVGLLAALNCLTDALVTQHPPLAHALAGRYQAKIAELDEADEEAHRLAAKVVEYLLQALQQSPRAAQREPPAGSA